MSGVRSILLRNTGNYAIVDADDYDFIKSIGSWHESDGGYAIRRYRINGKNKTIRMHAIINGTPSGLVTDHINRNRLDNRKCNLRSVTQRENSLNSDRVVNAKGYYYSESKCRGNRHWVVDIKGICCTFATEQEAKKAVADIKSGVFVKPKDILHKICSKCGDIKQIYGGCWTCRRCSLLRMKKYYERRKLNAGN